MKPGLDVCDGVLGVGGAAEADEHGAAARAAPAQDHQRLGGRLPQHLDAGEGAAGSSGHLDLY